MRADMDYELVYSERRTLGITVERDGIVVVHAPEGTSRETVDRLVEKKKRWIASKIGDPQKYQAAPHPPGKELVSGESMLYLGRSYRIEITDVAGDEIRFDHIFEVPQSVAGRGWDAFRDWYVQRAEERLVPRATEWANRLGVTPSGISVTDVRYRWGSCTPSAQVRLNWRLIKAPTGVADYVIVHELAHLLEPSHNDRFWSIVRSQVHKVEASREWLKENGQLLEEDA